MLKLDFTRTEYNKICEELMLNDFQKRILEYRIKNMSIVQMAMKENCSESLISKEINKIKKKIVDVNTMLLDTIGLFNCFTRVTHNDFDAYLGNKVIFNQMCFLQISNANSELRELIRYYLGLRTFKQKQKKLIDKKTYYNK